MMHIIFNYSTQSFNKRQMKNPSQTTSDRKFINETYGHTDILENYGRDDCRLICLELCVFIARGFNSEDSTGSIHFIIVTPKNNVKNLRLHPPFIVNNP